MLSHKGNTLIESLLAFEIFISVLVLYSSLFSQILKQDIRLQNNYKLIMEKECEVLYQGNFTDSINMVLH